MIFLSYASEQRDFAEKVAHGLENAGHEVFFDRSNINPADDYNTVIRNGVEASELFVFCISPESVTKGSYALFELEFANAHFGRAVERVLPVMVVRTPYQAIPNFPKSVSVLEPLGDPVAATLAQVARLLGHWKKWRAWLLMGFAAALCVNALYQWTWPRLERHWVLTAIAAVFVIIAPLARWYWRREVSATRLVWAAPLLFCAIAGVASWLAVEFRPVTIWLLPGATFMPRMPADGRPSPFAVDIVVDGERTTIPEFGRAGALIGTNATIIGLGRTRGSAGAADALNTYLQQRVTDDFHELYLSFWRGSEPRQIDIAVFSNDIIRDAAIERDGETIPAVLEFRGNQPFLVVFVEATK
jgi:hypothetical protein